MAPASARERFGGLGSLLVLSLGVHFLLEDGIAGPHGQFPRPLAEQAPARTPKLVAGTWEIRGAMQIYGGVAINGNLRFFGASDDIVRAVDIATGKTYWEYVEQEHAQPIGLDRTTGDVYVDGPDELAKIDVRAGRIRWSRPTPGYFPIEHAIVSDAGTLVIIDDTGDMTGIDPVTGRNRWRSGYRCHGFTRSSVVIGGTLVMACGRNEIVRGIDLATGEERWQKAFAEFHPDKPAFRFWESVVLEAGRGRVALAAEGGFGLLDPATGKMIRRHVTKGERTVAFNGAMRISSCALGKTSGMCANDADTGKRLWSSPFPGSLSGYVTGEPPKNVYAVVADGRVYCLSPVGSPKGEVDQITVLDLRTGRRLTNWSLDGRTTGPDPLTIADGVVAVRLGLSQTVGLYADRPDLRGFRPLFLQ